MVSQMIPADRVSSMLLTKKKKRMEEKEGRRRCLTHLMLLNFIFCTHKSSSLREEKKNFCQSIDKYRSVCIESEKYFSKFLHHLYSKVKGKR